MSTLLSLLMLFVFLLIGVLLAKIPAVARSPHIIRIESVVLYALLFFMGFRLGRSIESGAELAEIGFTALAFAFVCAFGTALVLLLFYLVLRRIRSMGSRPLSHTASGQEMPEDMPPHRSDEDPIPFSGFSHLAEPLRLLTLVIGGFLLGFLGPFFEDFTGARLTTILLYILLVVVGIQLIRRGVNIKEVLLHPELIVLPFGTVVGTLSAALLLSIPLDLSWNKAAALASGFGWYSLSGVLITDMGDPILGSAAFLSNMLRETISLVCIPFIARSRFPHVGIGMAGATSMDVTLPVIERSCGVKAVPLAISHGAMLSLLVPLFVPLFFNIG